MWNAMNAAIQHHMPINLKNYHVRELADTGFVSVQNFVKLGLYLKKWYDKQQASWEVQILKFRNWICLRKLHRSGLDLLPFFQVLPSSAMVFTLIFRNSCSQNLRSFANILPKLDFTKFWRNTKCLCAETLKGIFCNFLLTWQNVVNYCHSQHECCQFFHNNKLSHWLVFSKLSLLLY